MMDFEIFEHTADQGIRAYGRSMKDVFINAAMALSTLSTDPAKVLPEEEFDLEISREEPDELLVAWLNELIFIQDSEGVYLCKFSIDTFEPAVVKGKAWGERIDREKHTPGSCLKAATYHCLKLEKASEGWMAQVIFDV